MQIGILGAGSMGAGIAQVASQAGHSVVLCDNNAVALEKAAAKLAKVMLMLVEKGKISTEEGQAIQNRIQYSQELVDFKAADLIIEAIIENLDIKKSVFQKIEGIVDENCIIASNTSSLSITALASALSKPERFIGIHFFNPAPIMKLVEVIPAIQTAPSLTPKVLDLIQSWGKTVTKVSDTPGFIVNRVARPFYSESLRILDEGLADVATIDWAMTEIGGFRMGPFTLMDFIGLDVNYAVTESVFAAFYYDPRYKPSLTQKRLTEAGWLGRKSGRGFYDYREGATVSEPLRDIEVGQMIFDRVITMLVNEAVDAVYMGVASEADIDSAMTKGVNYPKGLIAWGKEIGYKEVVSRIDTLYLKYSEDRYRCSPLLRRLATNA